MNTIIIIHIIIHIIIIINNIIIIIIIVIIIIIIIIIITIIIIVIASEEQKSIVFYLSNVFSLQGKGALVTYWLHGKLSSSQATNIRKTCSGASEFSSSGIEVELERTADFKHTSHV